MTTPRKEVEIIPGGAYPTLRLEAMVGPEGFDKLLENGLEAKALNGRDYWFLSADVIAAMAKCPSVKPAKRGRSRYKRHPRPTPTN